MKIGITCYPTYGGSGVVATELGKELASREYDVHFIGSALPIRLTMTDHVYFHEVEVLSYPLFEISTVRSRHGDEDGRGDDPVRP